MKTKKSSLSLILALVIVFVMANGAWATLYTPQTADGNTATPSLNIREDIDVSGDATVIGAYAINAGSIDMVGVVRAESTTTVRGIMAHKDSSYIHMTGDIETKGGGYGAYAATAAHIVLVGNVKTDTSSGIAASDVSTIDFTGGVYVSADRDETFGVSSRANSVVNMKNGIVHVTEGLSWHLYVRDATINLDNVTINDNNPNLMKTYAGGTVNAKNNSVLVGDILHTGAMADEAFAVKLTDSVLNGSAEAIDDIGVINVELVNSQWNVTGDTNTNGKITGDADSKVDFNGTDENITVIIDRLEGEAGISVKPGDKLIIKNPAGNVESSNPDVIEVITNDDGSVEIISKGDGEADLTYEYVDEDGKIKEVTVTVVSGAGSQPAASGGGGSSNCNTGVGAALFALLGLAFIQKRK